MHYVYRAAKLMIYAKQICKRTLDVVLSAVALCLLAPLLLGIALCIKWDSPGPILFRQQRMGRNFRLFEILKFRSMVTNAECLGGQITTAGDPRITAVGHFLRQSKLDELPQLFNILRGDMSFVGPRPEVPRYVELFHNDYRAILTVRPGLTDFASIRFRNEADELAAAENPEHEYTTRVLPAKIALAKEYVRRSSPWLDLCLVFSTLRCLVRTR